MYGNTKHSSPATFKIFEGCKDDICLKEDAHTDKKIYPKLNSKFNKISGNFSNNAETKENLIQMPHFKSSDQIFMAVTSKIKSNQKNLSNEGIEFFTKFYLSDSIKNTTEVTSEYISEARDILNSTDQYISATTPENIVSPYIMNSTYGSASHFNLTNDTYICFCDMLINECDINCCCDRDCNSNHLKVFTKCIEKDYDFESNYCYKNSFIFKNNSRNEIFQTKQGLFCIVRDNLRSVLQYKTKQIIKDLESFKKVLPKHFYLFENKQFVHPGFEAENYHAGSLIWTVQSGGMKPFGD